MEPSGYGRVREEEREEEKKKEWKGEKTELGRFMWPPHLRMNNRKDSVIANVSLSILLGSSNGSFQVNQMYRRAQLKLDQDRKNGTC